MADQLDFFKADEINKIAKKKMKADGLFFPLTGIYDKDTTKWVLIKFLKESLEFLSENEEARKMPRGKYVEAWIDENLPNIPGHYDNPRTY